MLNAKTAKNIINFVVFQGAWFLCVLLTNDLAAGITLALVALHIALISEHREREARFILMAAVLGICVDTLWQNIGVLSFPGHEGPYSSGMLPNWMLTIWLIFVTTLHHSLRWLGDSKALLICFPPIAGPVAYASAEALGAVEVGQGVWGYVALAVGWLIVFPTQVQLMHWLEEKARKSAPSQGV